MLENDYCNFCFSFFFILSLCNLLVCTHSFLSDFFFSAKIIILTSWWYEGKKCNNNNNNIKTKLNLLRFCCCIILNAILSILVIPKNVGILICFCCRKNISLCIVKQKKKEKKMKQAPLRIYSMTYCSNRR